MGVRSYNDGAAQAVAYTGTAGVSGSVIGAASVRLVSTSGCWVKLGAAPTAQASTAGNFYLPANSPIEMACQPTDKVSAVQDSAGGTLSVLPIS